MAVARSSILGGLSSDTAEDHLIVSGRGGTIGGTRSRSGAGYTEEVERKDGRYIAAAISRFRAFLMPSRFFRRRRSEGFS